MITESRVSYSRVVLFVLPFFPFFILVQQLKLFALEQIILHALVTEST